MKKIYMATAALALVFSVSILSTASVSAAEPKKKKLSTKSIDLCKKRVGIFAGFERDLGSWKSQYYEVPSDLSAYPKKEMVHMDGVKRLTQTSTGKVTVFVNGKEKEVNRVNYGLVLERHRGTREVASKEYGMTDNATYKSYDAQILQFRDKINAANANLNQELSGWKSAYSADINCESKEGQVKAKDLSKKRTESIKSHKTYLNQVKAESKKVQADYKIMAKEYRKVKKMNKANARAVEKAKKN